MVRRVPLLVFASIAARKGRHPRRKADHVPQRRNRAARADAPRRHWGPRRVAAGGFPNRCGRAAAARTSLEGRGQSGGGPAVSRPGPRRDATRRRLGPNTLAMPGAFPATAEGAWRRNRASGRCRQRHAAAAALGGKREGRRGHHAARLRVRGSRKGRWIAHHNSATPRPPRVAGRGRFPPCPAEKLPRRTRRRPGARRSARSRAWRTAPEGSRIRSPRGQGRWPGRGWAAWRGSGRRLSGRRRRPPSLPPAWGRAGSRQGRLRRRGRRP